MPRSGSGVFSRVYNWVNDRDSALKINASRMDDEFDGVATALSESIARDGQTTTTAAIPFAVGINTNTISERTSASGVTIDGMLLKDAGFIANELGVDVDCRIEGDTDANLLFTDASTDRVGIGTNTPGSKLDVAGTITSTSTDAGATEGPDIILYRNSASPAASDVIGGLQFDGEDSAGNTQTYGRIRGVISDPTSTSEDGQVAIRTVVAGTEADRVIVGQGVQVGSPTGGDPGTGKINATGLQINGYALGFRGALVKRTAVQSIPNNTPTAATFAGEDYDTDTIHDNVTSNTRLTVPTGVTKVKVGGSMIWSGTGTGIRVMQIFKGGSSFAGYPLVVIDPVFDSSGRGQAWSAVVTVTAGEFFEMYVTQTSGGALDLAGADNLMWFAMEIVG